MKKVETELCNRLKRVLAPCPIELKNIENSVDQGTPDIYFYSEDNEGWAELKQIPRFPVRATTKIKIPFRPGQYGWIRKRLGLMKKSTCFLILRIGNKMYIFKNEFIQEEYSLDEMNSRACFISSYNEIRNAELYRILNK